MRVLIIPILLLMLSCGSNAEYLLSEQESLRLVNRDFVRLYAFSVKKGFDKMRDDGESSLNGKAIQRLGEIKSQAAALPLMKLLYVVCLYHSRTGGVTRKCPDFDKYQRHEDLMPILNKLVRYEVGDIQDIDTGSGPITPHFPEGMFQILEALTRILGKDKVKGLWPK